MQVIDKATVKTLLGITDTSLDVAIDSQIPFIDSKVKLITRNRWNTRAIVNLEAGSPYIEVVAIYGPGFYGVRPGYNRLPSERREGYRLDLPSEASEYIEAGQLLEGTGIPSGSYVTEIYDGGSSVTLGGTDYTIPVIEASENVTVTETAVDIFLGMPIGYQSLIAKAVYWAIQHASTELPSAGLQSKSLGPARVTYSDSDAMLDNRYGVPAWLVKGLPRYHGGH